MVMDIGVTAMKYLLFLFNLIIVVLGLLLIAFGFVLIGDVDDVSQIVHTPHSTSIALIVAGFIIFVIAFFGCCGAYTENYCLLITYASIVFLLFLVELIAAGVIYSFRSRIRDESVNIIKKWMDTYHNENATQRFIDGIQKKFECCGADTPFDWKPYRPFYWHHSNTTANFPDSCCASTATAPCSVPYKDGCVDAIYNSISKSSGIVIGVAIAAAVVQLLTVIFACLLGRDIRKFYDRFI